MYEDFVDILMKKIFDLFDKMFSVRTTVFSLLNLPIKAINNVKSCLCMIIRYKVSVCSRLISKSQEVNDSRFPHDCNRKLSSKRLSATKEACSIKWGQYTSRVECSPNDTVGCTCTIFSYVGLTTL